jgi:hypothetical protein
MRAPPPGLGVPNKLSGGSTWANNNPTNTSMVWGNNSQLSRGAGWMDQA